MTSLPISKINTRPRRSLAANPSACTGCRTCESVCSLTKTGAVHPEMARLHIERHPFEGKFIQKVCRQCSIPHCLKACPVDAIAVSDKHGEIRIDKKKCNGCRLCQEACPHGMIVFDERRQKAFKCDLCGGNPFCVRFCPMNALGVSIFGRKDE